VNKKKNKGERSAHMQEVSAGLQDVLGMTQWRKEHPQATLREIEAAVDAQMNQLRAQLIQELVHMGEAGEWSDQPAGGRPRCEHCGTVLLSRGKQTRWLQTNGGEAVKLERSYGTCPDCGQGIFPPG
jgi:ribosomal protein S27AE